MISVLFLSVSSYFFLFFRYLSFSIILVIIPFQDRHLFIFSPSSIVPSQPCLYSDSVPFASSADITSIRFLQLSSSHTLFVSGKLHIRPSQKHTLASELNLFLSARPSLCRYRKGTCNSSLSHLLKQEPQPSPALNLPLASPHQIHHQVAKLVLRKTP